MGCLSNVRFYQKKMLEPGGDGRFYQKKNAVALRFTDKFYGFVECIRFKREAVTGCCYLICNFAGVNSIKK